MKENYIVAVGLAASLNLCTFTQSFDSSPKPENVAVAAASGAPRRAE